MVSAFITLFPSLTTDQVKEALQSTEASGMLLLWKKLGVFTRINLREGSMDILFIWKTGGASSVYTERIIQRLWEGIQAAGQPQFLKASEALRVRPAGEVIRVSSLMQLYSLRQADSAKLLLNGLKSSLLEMRFRIRTDNVIENFDNIWRTTLEEFPRSVVDETGDRIDLSDPTNIDVAYERVCDPVENEQIYAYLGAVDEAALAIHIANFNAIEAETKLDALTGKYLKIWLSDKNNPNRRNPFRPLSFKSSMPS